MGTSSVSVDCSWRVQVPFPLRNSKVRASFFFFVIFLLSTSSSAATRRYINIHLIQERRSDTPPTSSAFAKLLFNCHGILGKQLLRVLTIILFFCERTTDNKKQKKCFPQGQLNRLDSSLVLLLLLYLSGGSHTHKFLRNDTVLVFVSPHRNIFLKKKKIGSSSYFILFFLPSCLPYVSCAFGGATRSIDIKKTTSLFLSMCVCVCVSLTLVGVSSATHLNPVCRYMMLHNSPFSWRRAMFSPSNESCALLLFFFCREPGATDTSKRERESKRHFIPLLLVMAKRERKTKFGMARQGGGHSHTVCWLWACVCIYDDDDDLARPIFLLPLHS